MKKILSKILNKVFNFIIGVGLIAYGVFFYFNGKGRLSSQPAAVQVTHMSSIDVDQTVNKHLQETSKKMVMDRFDQKKMIEEALRDAKKLQVKPEPPPDIPFETQIHKGQVKALPSQAPSKADQKEVLDRAEYARQFIENARRGGYEIELSDDLEVIRATPIRKPSQEIDQVEILPSN